MPRSTRLGLIAAAVLLLLLGGAYTAYWLIAADRIREGIAAWAETMRGQGLDASWQGSRVAGYPFSFRLELSRLRLRGAAAIGEFDLQAPKVAGSIRPWDFRDWTVTAPQGLDAALAQRQVPLARIAASAATGAVSVLPAGDAAGVTRVWLSLDEASVEPAAEPTGRITAATANFWATLPGSAPHSENDRSLDIAADLHGVGVPAVPAPFTGKMENVALGLSVMGTIPTGPPRQSADAWRRSGGTVELDHFNLGWGGLRVTGSGTAALDSDLQPVGAFSGAVAGYDQLLAGLVSAGRMRANDAGLARVALGFLAKTGPDGRPQIQTSFTIQNGQMYLGPVKLGPAPRIDWR
jgi:hypothetical protein